MIFRLTSSFIALVISLALINPAIATPQVATAETSPQATVDPKLDQLVQTAKQTQQSGDLKLAASQWQSVWKQFPDSPFVGLARLQAGTCHQQLKDYPLAIENLRAAIPKLTDQDNQLPTAKLLLGYCQYQHGQRLFKTTNDAATRKQASDLLITATRTFDRLLKTNPTFPDAFQACYFLGGAYEELDRKQAAIDAYKRMATIANPKGLFKYESIFAIADLHFELGQYGEAKRYFDQFLEAPETKDRPDRNLVVLASAQTSIALGESAKRNGIAQEAKLHFADAEALLKSLAQPTGSDDRAIALAQEAQRQLAFSYRQQEKFQAAATSYAEVYKNLGANAPQTVKIQTATDAGFCYLKAGDVVNGEAFLKIATASVGPTPSPDSAEAARWLADAYLKQRRFGDAYELSSRFVPVAQPPSLVPLKMSQAKAAIEIDGKEEQAIILFQGIATNFPDHESAASALSSAAHGQIKTDQYEAAVSTADLFLERYPESSFLTEVLEVKGNALSLSGQHSNAEKVFGQLINNPALAKNVKRSNWILSSARAKFKQQNFADTITDLQATIESIKQPAKAAEALHLVGTSHYQLQQYADATKNLTAAIAVGDRYASTDESQFYLGLSLLEQDRYQLAQQTINSLATASPNSPYLFPAYVQLGNNRYEAGQQDEAIALFQKVIDATDAKQAEKANAIHGAAWAHLKAQNLEPAQRLFKQVIETYPEWKQVATAKTGLAHAQRLAGVDPAPIEDPAGMPDKTEGTGEAVNTDLLRKTGLAQVRAKEWDKAITTFETLINAAPDDAQADADLHELAWAHRSLNHEDQALVYFGKIASEKPNSRFAAEANYHLGKSAYDSKRYSDAVKAFQACVDREDAKANVREKAAYKLAWAYYKQNKFPEAYAAFTRQTDQFPTGELLADGMFMSAESLFRNQQFGQALIAYKAAKPVMESSTVVDKDLKWLTVLHGVQSAIKQQDYLAAIDWSQGIAESDADESLKQDVFLEIGSAYNGLKDSANATKFWRLATPSLSRTGAQATCLIGNQFFKDKMYEDAEREYKKVFFGFGGKTADKDIRPWQAFARYEAARSNFIRSQETSDAETKQAYLKLAIEHFQALINDYPDDKLAPTAQRQIEKLK